MKPDLLQSASLRPAAVAVCGKPLRETGLPQRALYAAWILLLCRCCVLLWRREKKVLFFLWAIARLPEGKHPGRDPVALLPTVVLKINVDALLANEIELIPMVQLPEPGVFSFQGFYSGSQLLHFPGIPEVNDQMNGFLLHVSQRWPVNLPRIKSRSRQNQYQ